MSNLQMGASGPEVLALQRELNQVLAPGQRLVVDGDFGPRTRAAVMSFQRSHGLEVDGVVGPHTRAALAEAAGGKPPPPPPDGSGGKPPSGQTQVSLAQLHAIMPHLTNTKGNLYIEPLNEAMTEAHVTTHLRKSAFIAQIAEESVELLYFEEIASGWEYDLSRNPAKAHELGNTHPGDGPRYKGRGPIQLTGRYNYRACGAALGLDLEGHPEQASHPNVGFRVAGWYWTSRGLNHLADAGDLREITRRINGGYNGYSVRLAYYEHALRVLA